MAPEIELAQLWSNEGDDIKIQLDAPYFGDAGSVTLWLTSNSTNRYDLRPPLDVDVDGVTLEWSFHGDTIATAVADALDFAQTLAAFAPQEDC